ncbi:hypothetical protein MNB_SV-15-520 [hydrothermal vent metagenome]|uniref:Porin domain-containing protein n=1 Tax=hydrothermal vent metagenome TaxID=652676 RepID=A0A1W1EJ52_9ZZZZ
MRKITITISIATILMSNLIAEDREWKSKHSFFGFAQVGAKLGDGANLGDDADVAFEADRIRLGWKYFSGPIAGKVFLDFAKDGTGDIEVPNIIKDAFIAYNFDSFAVVKAGVLKTPVGMGFTIPGWNLDVIKRGFDKKLAFERATGVMLSGRDIGFDNNAKVNGLEMGHERPWKGFGYDVMITGATGRSGAVVSPDDIKKAGNGYMARVMFDWREAVHIEASYGVTPNADGNTSGNSPDYKVLNFGIDSHFDKSNMKAEYYSVENIRGVAGWDMTTLALTGTYAINNRVELAIKDIRGKESIAGVDSDAVNTYLGINYYLNPKNDKMDRKSRRARNQHRVQLNYVATDVDNDFKGVGALYKDDTILMQYQFKF